MKQGYGPANLAIAWEYNGRALEVIPARFSLVELTCAQDSRCGATLDTWKEIGGGNTIFDLIVATNNFTKAPDSTTRLTTSLEGPTNAGWAYGSRIKGWLMPPVTGEFVFWIASDDQGEFWLSSDSNPGNMGRKCSSPQAVWPYFFTAYPDQKSSPISLDAGRAYYYEVRYCVAKIQHFACGTPIVPIIQID